METKSISNNKMIEKSKPKINFTAFMTSDVVVNKVNQIVGDKSQGSRFISSIISAVNTNPTLKECDNGSILSAALLGESLKLPPSPQLGRYYMMPFKDKERGMIAVFVLGYKGYIELAMRSGQYKDINVIEIREGEYKGLNIKNGNPIFEFIGDDDLRNQKNVIGYMAYFELVNGFEKCIYWSKSKMEQHALKYSTAYKAKKGYSYWEKDFDGMAFKTMLRQLISKWGIMSVDMQNAYEKDMAFINEDGTPDYVDNKEYVDVADVDFEITEQPSQDIKSLDDIE